MATTEISITVDRPIEEVFAYVVAIEKLHEWTPVIQAAWPVTGTPPEQGSTYIVRAQVMGRTMEIPSEVVGYEPNRLFAYRSSGFLNYTDTITFEQTAAGTRVTEHLDMRSNGGLSRLLDPIKLAVSRRSHQTNQRLLKSLLEEGRVAATG